MTILVTGASGQLGRLVVSSLLGRGVAADEIVAAARDTGKVDDLAAQGVLVRRADYAEPDSLDAAFAGVDRLLLISSSEIGQRVAQHANVVAAAVRAGVALIVYTSIANAPTSSLQLAGEHVETERVIVASGIPYVFLRNSWYTENYTAQMPGFLAHGVAGSAGQGRVSAATRADFADAAAAVLVSDGHEGSAYELGGADFTMSELAAEVSRQSGSDVRYSDLPEDAYRQVLIGAGLPEAYAALLADSDRGIAAGDLLVAAGDLELLIGRAPTSLADAVALALA